MLRPVEGENREQGRLARVFELEFLHAGNGALRLLGLQRSHGIYIVALPGFRDPKESSLAARKEQ